MKAFQFIVSYPMNYRKNIVALSYAGFVKQAIEFSWAFSATETEPVKGVENAVPCFTACGKSNVSVGRSQRGTVLGLTLPFPTLTAAGHEHRDRSKGF